MADFDLADYGGGWLLNESGLGTVDSGNKRRKLEAFLRGKDWSSGLISVGSAYSSHLLAVSAAAAQRRIPAQLIVLEREGRDPLNFPHIRLATTLGAAVRVVDDDDPFEAIERLKAQAGGALWVPAGGHSVDALSAYEELHATICAEHPEVRNAEWIWLPYGTGTTACGFIRSISKLGLRTRVLGVSVSRPRQGCLRAAREMLSEEEVDRHLVIDDRFAGRYEERTDETESARKRFFIETGVLADPIYNAKCLSNFYRQNKGRSLVVITGGAANNIL